jgi:hypothetical protein
MDTLRLLRWPNYFVDPLRSDTTSGDVIAERINS